MWLDSCEAHFQSKKTQNLGAVRRITYKFTVSLNARRSLLERTHGIWKGCCDTRFPLKKIRTSGEVGRVSYKFTVTSKSKRILPEKTKGFWRGWYETIFPCKTHGIGSVACQKNHHENERHAFYTIYTTISPGLAGGGVY